MSLLREAGASIRFAGLYTLYGIGYRWSYPVRESGKRPGNFLGKVSWNAMKEIEGAGPSWSREAGYYMSGCGVPGALLGDALYSLSGDGRADAVP